MILNTPLPLSVLVNPSGSYISRLQRHPIEIRVSQPVVLDVFQSGPLRNVPNPLNTEPALKRWPVAVMHIGPLKHDDS